jgi:hypothetical protein
MRLETDEERRLWCDCVVRLLGVENYTYRGIGVAADLMIEEFRKRLSQPIPDGGPTDADMRGRVDHGG